jgi:Zn-dependent protease with chaperone function
MVILAFLPIANCFLLYMIWRKLNRQFFVHLGADWKKSDRKIRIIWMMMVVSIIYLFVFPFVMYWVLPEEAGSFWRAGKVAGKIYYSVVCLFYLFYFLQLKRVIDRSEPGMNNVNYTSLLDD